MINSNLSKKMPSEPVATISDENIGKNQTTVINY